MIIFLYGEDSYRAREKLKEIVEHYKKIHKGGLNLKYFDCSGKSVDFSFGDFKDENRQASIFQGKKLEILTGIFSNADFKEKFLKEIKVFLKSEDIILIYEEEPPNKNDVLLKFLKKNAKCQEFEKLGGQKLKNWIEKEFKKQRAIIDNNIIEKLIFYVGDDLWRMANEIKKLSSFKRGKKVSSADVELLVKSKIDLNIFETIDAISQRNKKLALDLLHKHLEKGDSPLYLFSMINYQFRNLLIIKSLFPLGNSMPSVYISSLSKKLKIHPFVIKKTLWQIKRFSLEELKKIYQKLFEVDLDIKTGRIGPEIALDILVAEI